MRRKKGDSHFFLSLLWFMLLTFSAQARIYIPIDQPSDKRLPVAITKLIESQGSAKGLDDEIPEIIRKDLELSSYFEFLPPEAFLEPKDHKGIAVDTINFNLWTAIEAQALIKGAASFEGDKLTVQLKLFDPFLHQMLVGKQYTGKRKDARAMAHRFADEVMEALTGIRGPFYTKIVYSAIMGKAQKSVFVMDVDGENNYRVTENKSMNIGPGWSPDGGKIVFASYMRGNPDIYLYDLRAGLLKQLTNNKNLNITPTFSPDGTQIAFTSSVDGDPDIWVMNTSGKNLRKLSEGYGVDISPEYSPDGSEIVFASERAGRLHLFRQTTSGSAATRLTFVGQHNDTPSWSPDGTKIAFCSRDEGVFDIFVMNADGSFIQRLTKGMGNSEHPSWSPDGRFLAFQSSMDGGPAIYIMRFDGANPTRISKGNGILPEWGPRLK